MSKKRNRSSKHRVGSQKKEQTKRYSNCEYLSPEEVGKPRATLYFPSTLLGERAMRSSVDQQRKRLVSRIYTEKE